MNIELKPIAESKIRQLGGDVCGVLVRKDEKLAAVDEHGRVQWLQGGQGAEPVAEVWPSHHFVHQNHVNWLVDVDDLPNDALLYLSSQPAQQGSDVEPLYAENEALRARVAGLVEALEKAIKAAPSGGPLWHGSEQIVEARAALAAYRKQGDGK